MALAGEEDDVARPRPLERGLDRRPPVRDREHVHATVAARALRAAHDLLDDRVAVLAAGILVGRHDEPAPLAGDPAHLGRASPCRARRPSRTRRRARRPAPRQPARAGRARRRATPGSARSRRSPRTAGPGRSAPSGPGRPRRPRAPRGPRPASSPRPSPSATTASALWTLNRPASRSSSDASPGRRHVPDPQAPGVLLDPRRPHVRRRVLAVGQHGRRPPRGRWPRTTTTAGSSRLIDRELRPRASRRRSWRGSPRPRRATRTAGASPRGTPRTSRAGRGARG